MNPLVKDTIDQFFTKSDVKIGGVSEKTWNLEGLTVSLASDEDKYFVMLTSNKRFDWIMHFENRSNTDYSPEDKFILINATADIMDPGDIVTSEGGITPGGISCLKRYRMHGFDIIGKNKGKDVYWATSLIDKDKWNEWIKHADEDDYEVIDKSKGLTIENTRPVVVVLKKL